MRGSRIAYTGFYFTPTLAPTKKRKPLESLKKGLLERFLLSAESKRDSNRMKRYAIFS